MFTSWLRSRTSRGKVTQAQGQPLPRRRSRLLLEALEDRTLPTTVNEVLVTVVYQQVLQRATDPVGLSYWASKLDAGMTASQLVQAIQNSLENQTNEVTSLYVAILGRQGEPQGIGFWVSFLQSGHTMADAEVGFLTSAEFLSQNGSSSTSQVTLDAIYVKVLNRHVDPIGIAYWSGLMSSGTSTATVVLDIEKSPEAIANAVEHLYEKVLFRHGDPQGLKYWEDRMEQQGEDQDQVEATFVSVETVQRIEVFVVQISNLSTQTAAQVAQAFMTSVQQPLM
jgi:hypothetical protein